MVTCFTCPLRPSTTLAFVVPHGPVALPSSSVAAPQLAFTWREARLSCTSTASLSYAVLPPAAGSSPPPPPPLLPEGLSPSSPLFELPPPPEEPDGDESSSP